MDEKVEQFWQWLNDAADENFKTMQGLSPLHNEGEYLTGITYDNAFQEVISKFREIVLGEKMEEEPF